MTMFNPYPPPRKPRLFACKGCGRQATEEHVFSALSKVQDMERLITGDTPWMCTLCLTKQAERTRQNAAIIIELAPTEALILELFKRYGYVIVAFRTIPVEGMNDATEGLYYKGDYRLCQGLAMGMLNRIERDIVAAATKYEEGSHG